MTPPLESRKYLWDALRAADWVTLHIASRRWEDYLVDETLRLAVERQLEIVGEALGQMARRDPDTASAIPELGQIVGFRNVLAHGYADIDHERVWRIITTQLPGLRETLARLLGET